MNTPTIPLYCILGQTATGKTRRALDIAHERRGAILNADSRQIYKHLDIITGKTDYRDGYLFDLVEPGDTFSSHDYVHEAQKIIRTLSQENILPVLVGGTGHYVRHLLYGFDVKVGPDMKLRSQLQGKTVTELQHELVARGGTETLDSMNPSDRANPLRLIRKIEIVSSARNEPSLRLKSRISSESRCVGNSKPDCHAADSDAVARNDRAYSPTIEVYLHRDRDTMRKKIESRIDDRLEAGAIEECKKLITMGPKVISLCTRTIGYKSLISYIQGEGDLATAKSVWLHDEMRYAKAQSTYFRKYFPPCKCAYFSVS